MPDLNEAISHYREVRKEHEAAVEAYDEARKACALAEKRWRDANSAVMEAEERLTVAIAGHRPGLNLRDFPRPRSMPEVS